MQVNAFKLFKVSALLFKTCCKNVDTTVWCLKVLTAQVWTTAQNRTIYNFELWRQYSMAIIDKKHWISDKLETQF